jgi:hypothetical protein
MRKEMNVRGDTRCKGDLSLDELTFIHSDSRRHLTKSRNKPEQDLLIRIQ